MRPIADDLDENALSAVWEDAHCQAFHRCGAAHSRTKAGTTRNAQARRPLAEPQDFRGYVRKSSTRPPTPAIAMAAAQTT